MQRLGLSRHFNHVFDQCDLQGEVGHHLLAHFQSQALAQTCESFGLNFQFVFARGQRGDLEKSLLVA